MDQTVEEFSVMDRAWAWFQTHGKQVLLITGAVVVIALVVGFYKWRQHATAEAASAALSAVEAQRMLPGGSRGESPDAFLKVANDHAGSTAAARALLLAGGAFFIEGKYSDAQAQFQRFLNDYPTSPLRGQALLGIATCQEAESKTEDAVTGYKNVVDRHATEAVSVPAKFALARIYESQGKLDQALKLYEELSRGDASGSIANEAGLRADELRPKVAPVAPLTASPAVPPVLSAPLISATNQP